VSTFDYGADAAYFEMRVDDQPTTLGIARVLVKRDDEGKNTHKL